MKEPKTRSCSSSSSSSSSSTIFYTRKNDQTTPTKTTLIPIESSSETLIPIPVHLPPSIQSIAAVKIQSTYRSHLVRTLMRTISAVNSETDHFERQIQRQETVDLVRTDNREKLRMSENLMSLLLRLDSVPGIYPPVRDLRRFVSRRIVALQEVLDSVAEARVEESDEFIPTSWDEIVARMGGECEERGEENEGFGCMEKLGFWFEDINVNMAI